MEYLPTFGSFIFMYGIHVGKYSIHGAYGKVIVGNVCMYIIVPYSSRAAAKSLFCGRRYPNDPEVWVDNIDNWLDVPIKSNPAIHLFERISRCIILLNEID